MFFQLPNEFNSLPAFTLSTKIPNENCTFGFIGYHTTDEETEKEMYSLTSTNIPNADELLNIGRSISLGILVKSGPIATTISTTAEQSSGGPLLDDDLNVFGISVGSYYDNPQALPPLPSLSSAVSEIFSYDVVVLENEEKEKSDSRNRNLALTIQHPGFGNLYKELCLNCTKKM